MAALALGLVVSGVACAPRQELPPGVRSLRLQRQSQVITLPVWDLEVTEEVASNPSDYSGKTLIVERAYLDPAATIALGKDVARFPLAGGGAVVAPTQAVPAWLRQWTGAPLKVRGTLRLPRRADEEQSAPEPILKAESIDFAHPLELAFIGIETAKDGTWATVRVENYRGEPARATLELSFGATRQRERLRSLAPGESQEVRLKLFGPEAPQWAYLPPMGRSLRLAFDDGSATSVDLGKWLEEPPASLLDWGYTFTPPGTAVLALSADGPEAELERFAALELRSYLAQFTDANIEPREPDAKDPLPALPLLVVGTPAHNPLAAELVRQGGLEARLRELGDDGYLLKTLRHNGQPALLVTASTPSGLVYGVYALLGHYGVRFTLSGARLPNRAAFRVLDVDEAKAPLFPRRLLVASGPEPASAARWSQWQWLSMFDLAAKNRFNEVVMPLDGLEATFAYEPGRSRSAVFPFEVGPYACVAEAYLAHQRGLAILADTARRRGIALSFAHHAPDGKLLRAAPPACLGPKAPPAAVGQAIPEIDDPGDFLGLPRVEETAKAAADLLAAKAPVLAVPYRTGSRARASFLAKFAWDKALTPEAYYRGWADTLCDGEAVEKLTRAILEADRIDGDVLAAAPRPFGLGVPLAMPVEEQDLACDWTRLRARAAAAPAVALVAELKAQTQKLRDLQARLEPIHAAFRDALGTVAPPWEEPLFEAAPATRRSERVSESIYMFRALLGALASVQEGALAYYAGLGEPAEALPEFDVAWAKLRKARRILLWVLARTRQTDMAPTLAADVDRIGEQAGRLEEILGPAAEAEPVARLSLGGSDAIVYLFRTRSNDVYAAYKLAGTEAAPLRLNTQEARLFRRGQPPQTIRAEGGLFLVPLTTVPTYIVARRAAWPGQPEP